jgi:hypothetical protein
MVNLIRKELILNRLNILIFGGMIAAYAVYMPLRNVSTGFLMVSIGIISAFIPISFQAREDRFKGAALNCSLPTSRNQLILARYITGWLMMMAGIFLTIAILLIIPGGRVMILSLLTLRSLILWIFIMSLVFSLILPFTMRFGFIGVMVFLVSVQILGILMLVVAQIFRGKTNAIRALINGISGLVRTLKAGLGETGFLFLGVLFILIMNVLSFFISRHLFARKDL